MMYKVAAKRTRKTLFTAEELLRLPKAGRRVELVKGVLYEMPPAGGGHGRIAMRIGILLGSHVLENRLGETFAAETGFILRRDPDTVRAPDVAFITKDRLPPERVPSGYIELIPDLVVEVVSSNDRAREVQEKVDGWLNAGTSQVWVLDPSAQTVTVHRRDHDPRTLSGDDLLHGDPLVSGFVCTVKDLFA